MPRKTCLFLPCFLFFALHAGGVLAQHATTTMLSVSPEPASPGTNITLKAAVTRTGATGTPTGTVTFTAYGNELASVPLNGSGTATYIGSSSGLPVGNYTVTASYGGDGNDQSSSGSATVELRKSSTTKLSIAPNPVVAGVPVTISITVAPVGSSGVPTGNVTLFADNQSIASIHLTGGKANTSLPTAGVPAGTYSVTARYSGDGNFASSASTEVSVTVEASGSPIAVTVPANDVAWDAVHNLLYISVPASAGANGNSIATVNPSTGAIEGYFFAGSNPDLLSVSANAQYLYVGVDGADSVERFDLSTDQSDLTVSLGSGISGSYFAGALVASPGSDHTWAVSGFVSGSDPSAIEGVVVYDDGTARPTKADGFGPGGGGGVLYDSLQWGADNSAIYAENNEDTGFDYYTLTVNSQGVSLNKDQANAFSCFGGNLHFDKTTGLVYSDCGQALNAQTGALEGSFGIAAPMVPDGANGKVFFAGSSNTGSGISLESYDINHYTPLQQIQLPNVTGETGKIIRYGESGIAVLTYQFDSGDTNGTLYLLNNASFVNGTAQSAVAPMRLRGPRKTRTEVRAEKARIHLNKQR